MAKLDERIGFLGGGNMAFAIGYGLINRGKLPVFFLCDENKFIDPFVFSFDENFLLEKKSFFGLYKKQCIEFISRNH